MQTKQSAAKEGEGRERAIKVERGGGGDGWIEKTRRKKKEWKERASQQKESQRHKHSHIHKANFREENLKSLDFALAVVKIAATINLC